LRKFMRSTRSRRHRKNLNQDLKEAKVSSENSGKAENAPLDLGKVEAEVVHTEVQVDHAGIETAEENGVDR
jgi:hypothetical protein